MGCNFMCLCIIIDDTCPDFYKLHNTTIIWGPNLCSTHSIKKSTGSLLTLSCRQEVLLVTLIFYKLHNTSIIWITTTLKNLLFHHQLYLMDRRFCWCAFGIPCKDEALSHHYPNPISRWMDDHISYNIKKYKKEDN